MDAATDSGPPPWEQLPGEPHKWFIRFERYKLLGIRRSLFAAYQQERALTGREQTVQGAPQSWRTASKKYLWDERVKAWDLQQIANAEAEWDERRRKLREKEWEVAQALISKAEQMLVFPLASTTRKQEDGDTTIITEVKPMRWSMGDAGKMMDTASKLARLAAEMETSRGRVDLDNMTDAQVVELIKKELGLGAPGSVGQTALPADRSSGRRDSTE